MIPPKLNWTKDDYFNVEDYNRITENLNAVSSVWSEPTVDYPVAYHQTYYIKPLFLLIAGHYNRLADKISGFEKIPTEGRKTWFNWKELNRVEQISTLFVYVPWQDNCSYDMHDKNGDVIYCKIRKEEKTDGIQ